MHLLNSMTSRTPFVIVPHDGYRGAMESNGGGEVMIMSGNGNTIVPYVKQKSGDNKLAHGIAS